MDTIKGQQYMEYQKDEWPEWLPVNRVGESELDKLLDARKAEKADADAEYREFVYKCTVLVSRLGRDRCEELSPGVWDETMQRGIFDFVWQ